MIRLVTRHSQDVANRVLLLGPYSYSYTSFRYWLTGFSQRALTDLVTAPITLRHFMREFQLPAY